MAGYVGIPTSYTPVEYIESNGTQYIDTGFKMSSNTKIETKLSSDTSGIITAVGVGGSYQSFSIQTYNGNYRVRWRSGLASNTQVDSTVSAVLSTPHIFEVNSTNAKIDGNIIGNTSTYSFTEPSNLFIFAMSSSNSAISLATGRIYYYKIYDNSTLVRNFIPVVNQDNVACLYDLVEGKFYYNQGTGTFTAGTATGSEVTIGDRARKITKGYVGVNGVAQKVKKGYVGVTSSYTPVEYIESISAGYIDTGVPMTNSIKVEVNFQLSSINTNYHNMVVTAYQEVGSKGFLFAQRNNNSKFSFAYGSGWSGTEVAADLLRHTAYINDNSRCILDSTTLKSSISGGDSNLNILLFGTYEAGSAPAYRLGRCKIYSCKIYNSGTLVRDLIPVLDDDNVPCFYDLVEGKFYRNKGFGSFTAGNVTGAQVMLASSARKIFESVTLVNYLESSGTQWINTGVCPNANTCTEIKFMFHTLYTSNTPDWVAGVYLDYSPNRYQVLDQDVSTNTPFLGCMTTSSSNVRLLNPADTNWHIVKYNDENHNILFDGVQKTTSPTWTNNNSRHLTLFGRYDGGRVDGLARATRIEYCKITDTSTGTLIRDYVPALDGNNTPCLYDKVTKRFFYNCGTGTFLYG